VVTCVLISVVTAIYVSVWDKQERLRVLVTAFVNAKLLPKHGEAWIMPPATNAEAMRLLEQYPHDDVKTALIEHHCIYHFRSGNLENGYHIRFNCQVNGSSVSYAYFVKPGARYEVVRE